MNSYASSASMLDACDKTQVIHNRKSGAKFKYRGGGWAISRAAERKGMVGDIMQGNLIQQRLSHQTKKLLIRPLETQ